MELLDDILNNRVLIFLLSVMISYGHWIIYMLCVPRMLQNMQQESYQNRDYIRWLVKNYKMAFKSGLKQFLVCIIAYGFITLLNYILLKTNSTLLSPNTIIIEFYTMFVLFYISNILQIKTDKKNRKMAKKKLVYTARAKRLLFWNFVLMIFLDASFVTGGGITIFVYYSLFIVLLPISMLIANWFALPTEQFVKDHYVSSARRKLRKKTYKNLIRIGITGSFRKNKYQVYFKNNSKRKVSCTGYS